MWRMTFRVTLGQSTNGTVFNKSVGNIVCDVESVVHQDARYHTLLYQTSQKCGGFQQHLKCQQNPPHLMLSPRSVQLVARN